MTTPYDRLLAELGACTPLGAAISVLAFATIVSIAPAHGAPGPDNCTPASSGDDNVCIARLISVTANDTDGTITGTPVGSRAPITLWGPLDAYLKSQGFGDTPPDPVQRWDAAIDAGSKSDLSGPNWYGEAKSRAFLPRSLDELASQFPPDVIVVRFVPDDTHSGWFRLVSIQPVAQ
jgi:hypothetical protein